MDRDLLVVCGCTREGERERESKIIQRLVLVFEATRMASKSTANNGQREKRNEIFSRSLVHDSDCSTLATASTTRVFVATGFDWARDYQRSLAILRRLDSLSPFMRSFALLWSGLFGLIWFGLVQFGWARLRPAPVSLFMPHRSGVKRGFRLTISTDARVCVCVTDFSWQVDQRTAEVPMQSRGIKREATIDHVGTSQGAFAHFSHSCVP